MENKYRQEKTLQIAHFERKQFSFKQFIQNQFSRKIFGRISITQLTLLAFLPMCGCSAAVLHNSSTVSTTGTPPCEIVIEHLTLGDTPMPDLQAVEDAVSAITLPAINCTVKIENIPIADHATRISLMSAQNDQLDIINTGRTISLSELVADGALLPLDDLLGQYGTALLDKADTLLEANLINNQTYAIPANLYCGGNSGFLYNQDMADKYGLSLSETMSIAEIESIANTLHTHGKYLLSQGDGSNNPVLLGTFFPAIVPVGSNMYANGVSVSGDSGTDIKNVFETEEYLKYCQMLRRWKENGWIPDDSLTSGLLVNQLFQNQEIFMTWLTVNPVEKALQEKNYPFSVNMFATTMQTPLRTSQVQEDGWGISSNSKNPEKAMEFLNLMHSNTEISNLLMNGIEGQEYQKISDHIITYPEHVSANNIGYSRYFSVFGDFMDIYQWQPVTEDFYQELKDFQSQTTVSPLLGYTFDVSPVASEYAAVMRVLSEYLPPLECGMIADVEEAVKNMNVLLSDAGIEQIIQENQRQLDLWLDTRE